MNFYHYMPLLIATTCFNIIPLNIVRTSCWRRRLAYIYDVDPISLLDLKKMRMHWNASSDTSRRHFRSLHSSVLCASCWPSSLSGSVFRLPVHERIPALPCWHQGSPAPSMVKPPRAEDSTSWTASEHPPQRFCTTLGPFTVSHHGFAYGLSTCYYMPYPHWAFVSSHLAVLFYIYLIKLY